MNSFISSFKAPLAAAAAILCIEAATYLLKTPNFVERSNYLNFNYLEPELFHKMIIYEKLRTAIDSPGEIVQVGDSSGFHGINPDIVERYLGGMRYINLSCCANTGFDGYYDLAKTVLDRDRNAKALVLYITLNNLPTVAHDAGDQVVGGPMRIHDSFTSPWAPFWPPTMSLRSDVAAVVYCLTSLNLTRFSESLSRQASDGGDSWPRKR